MDAQIEIDGNWFNCSMSYPNNKPPLSIPGPLGTQQWQQSPYAEYNAKITMPIRSPIVPPRSYKVRLNDKIVTFEAHVSKGSNIWGNVF